MEYRSLFERMHPGFFGAAFIKSLPEDAVYAELIMDLRSSGPNPAPDPCPGHISFGMYSGEPGMLREAVSRVDEDWIQYYGGKNRAFCAFDGERIASFCILEDWGILDGLHIGGTGCVGTVPAYRKQGIGLEMVRRATNVLKAEGFGISWVHYTHLWSWYEKLGYRTVLEWNRGGFIS